MVTGEDITSLLHACRDGDRAALDRLIASLYGELRRLARSHRRHWQGNETLDTTALIHEVYLKLSRQKKLDWSDRKHFFASAGRAMRHILVSYADAQRAAKRGGGKADIPLEEATVVAAESVDEILALDAALKKLEVSEERQSRVVECRFFAGLSIEQTAEALGISPATVKRDWTLASAWLHNAIAEPS